MKKQFSLPLLAILCLLLLAAALVAYRRQARRVPPPAPAPATANAPASAHPPATPAAPARGVPPPEEPEDAPAVAPASPSAAASATLPTPVVPRTADPAPPTAPAASTDGPAASPLADPSAASAAAYAAGLGRVAALGDDLPRAEIESLYRQLAQRPHPTLGDTELHSLKNQILDKLLDQRPLPRDLGATLAALLRDATQTELLRNYSLQHFEPYLRARAVSRPGLDLAADPDAAPLLAAYHEALGQTRTSLAGTALLGIERATAADAPLAGHPLRAEALAAALRLAGDRSADPRTRLAAIQVCAVASLPAALPAIRVVATDPAASTALRATAIHALGALGTAVDIPLLRETAAAGQPYLAPAATAALEKIVTR